MNQEDEMGVSQVAAVMNGLPNSLIGRYQAPASFSEAKCCVFLLHKEGLCCTADQRIC